MAAVERRVGFGIIGCGWVAGKHAEAIAATPQAALVAAVDHEPERASRLTAQYEGTPYAQLRGFLAHPDLDVVVVCTPNGLHLDPVRAAAAAGKRIILEKPLEVTREKAEAVLSAAREAGVEMAVNFPNRFNPQFRLLKAALAAGRLGRILLANVAVKVVRSTEYYRSSPWRGQWALEGGGVLMTQAIHALDLLHWLAGPATEVMGLTATLRHPIATEDTAVAAVRLQGGGLATITASTATVPEFGQFIELHGESGTVRLQDDRIALWVEDGREITPAPVEFDIWRDGFGGLIGNACRSVLEGEALAIPAAEGLPALSLILGVYESARSQRPVSLIG